MKNKEVFCVIGSKALIVTGRSSAKKNGSYDDVCKALSKATTSGTGFVKNILK